MNGYNALQFACDQGTSFWGHFIVDEACLRGLVEAKSSRPRAHGLTGFEAPVSATSATGIDRGARTLPVHLPGQPSQPSRTWNFRATTWATTKTATVDQCDWHGFTSKRKPVAYLGSADAPPYSVHWDLSMLPEQRDLAVRAVVYFKQFPDLVYVTPATRGLATPPRSARVRIYPAAEPAQAVLVASRPGENLHNRTGRPS